MPAFETYGAPEEAALQADKLIRQSKTFLVRSVGTGIIAPFDNKRFPIVSPSAAQLLCFVRGLRITLVERCVCTCT